MSSTQPAADRIRSVAQNIQQGITADWQLPVAAATAVSCCDATVDAGWAAAGQHEQPCDVPEPLREHVMVCAGLPARL